MTVLFHDGFDYYSSTDLATVYTNVGAGVSALSSAYSRVPSGQGIRITGSNTASGTLNKAFTSNYTSGVVGFAFNSEIAFTTRPLVDINDGATCQIGVGTNASGQLMVFRSTTGTVLATGTTILSTATWYYVELKFTISDTVGSIELHLNGSTEIAATGSLDTKNTANTQWNAVGFGTGNSWTIWLDDLYIIDASTSPNSTFLGPVRSVPLWMTGNGNYAQWTPNGASNYGSISDRWEDGDITFNQSSTTNQIDTFTMQDVPISSGSIYALSTHTYAKQDAGAGRTIAPVIRIGGTDYVGTSVSLVSSGYENVTQVNNVSPATSSAWGVSEVNGMETGYKLTA